MSTFDHVNQARTPGGLSYLERKADSETVTIFFHGLGLDATDYFDYLRRHNSHSIAVNLRGYEPDGTDGLSPVPLASHIMTSADFVEEVCRENADKKVVLVGFSLGADLVLQLAEHWGSDGCAAASIHAAVLLDPNVNQSTMTISKLFAEADPQDPVAAFKKLINLASDRHAFRALCQYLVKVTPKDFAHVSQLSRDMLSYWNPTGYEQFEARLRNVARMTEHVRLVLSAAYEEHLPAVDAATRQCGSRGTISADLTKLDHFDLIGEETLSLALASVAD